MKLVSIDSEYAGDVDEIRRYRKGGDGALYASVLLIAPGAWYSGVATVELNVDLLKPVEAA